MWLDTKGQIVSKRFFLAEDSSKKWTKTRRILVKTNSFVRFLEESSAWQFAFKIKWPLVTFSGELKRRTLLQKGYQPLVLNTWLVWEIQTPYKNFDQKLSSLGNKSLGKKLYRADSIHTVLVQDRKNMLLYKTIRDSLDLEKDMDYIVYLCR